MIKRFIAAIFITAIAVVAITGYAVFRYSKKPPEPQPAKITDQQITVIEGWTTKDIAGMLSKKNILQPADFLAEEKAFNTGSYPLLNSKPKSADLEGFLFPDTYRIADYPGLSTTTVADGIIKKQLDNFSEKFTPAMEQAATARGYSVYQVVTLASIIEKETGRNVTTDAEKQSLDNERKIIAGIFYNRLNAGMALQSDATINFITGKNDPQATDQDTQIDSPYNTYKYAGLPPGPICNPSLSSLMAAVYPTASDYYYFLHARATGQAIYSKTYEEHLQNKQKYLP